MEKWWENGWGMVLTGEAEATTDSAVRRCSGSRAGDSLRGQATK
jgi:hypothetical protein